MQPDSLGDGVQHLRVWTVEGNGGETALGGWIKTGLPRPVLAGITLTRAASSSDACPVRSEDCDASRKIMLDWGTRAILNNNNSIL